ncbi:MAG: putative MPP superfamily phosphohydrolase [Rhodothermales bacterium]
MAAIAGYFGSRSLVVKELSVRVSGLPDGFRGTRVFQVSDLHVGPHTPKAFLSRIASAIGDARPDMIVITGDQVDDYARDTESFGSAFGGLKAPLGVFAIAGNHDVYAGWNSVREGLSAMGMTVLVNEAVQVERGGDSIWLAGVGDPAGQMWHRDGGASAAQEVDATLRGIPPGDTVLLLAHNPALWSAFAERGVELTLSGHTHYGQLAIPRWNWNAAAPFAKHSMGSHRENDSLLYINPGTNYWGLPFRLGTPPEVTVLVLERCEEGEVPSFEAG